jgi:phosphoglycerate dehydrogenase-like enzyme
MTKIVVEQDPFLRVIPVILDPATPEEHCRAWSDFFAHDEPDFAGWCRSLRGRVAGLFPATIVVAEDQDDLRRKIGDADCVIVEGLRVGAEELALAKRLRCVQRFGSVTSNIDVAACYEHSIAVEIIRRRVNVAVAEQAFLLIIALAKEIGRLNGLVTAERLLAAGYALRPYDTRYSGSSNFARIPGIRTLNGATLGIIGMGEVGRELAARAAAFGMRVLYTQRNRIPAGDAFASRAAYATMDDLMAESDYISVNLPYNASTRGIVGAAALARVKPGAMLVNVARAELVDRSALMAALSSGRLGGYGSDVGYEEPALPDDPLLHLPNVVLMPHTAIASRENALLDLEEMCLKMWRGVTGLPLPHGS